MLMKNRLLLCLLLFIAVPGRGYGAFFHDPDLTWQTLQTDHFEIHFHNGEEMLIPKVAKIAEAAHVRVSEYFNWIPESRTHLILTDRMDFSNAYALPVPRNTMVIIVTPPDDVQSIGDYHDWLDLVITHEYTHIVHIDKAYGLPKGARDIFGRIAFFFPNALQPLWVVEGIASHLESQIVEGIGRGTNSSYRNLMRLEVAAGIKPLSQVNLPIFSWPAGTTRYLYGVYFFNYLRDTYGEEQTKKWIDTYSDNLIPFMINSNARQVYGKNMTQLWDEFTQYLKKEFEPEIEQLKQETIVEGKQITQQGYLTGYPRALQNGDLLYLKNNWREEPQLMLLPAGETEARPIADIYSGHFDAHPTAGILVAQIDNFRNVNYFSDLYHIDIQSGKKTQLTEGRRYKYAIWSNDAKNILAVHVSQGNTALHLLDSRGTYIKTLWQGESYEVLSEFDRHPTENRITASVWRPGTRWNLETFDLNTLQWQKLTHTLYSETQPRYTKDGKSIIFNADYSIATNLYSMNIESGTITQLTNVLGSASSGTALPDGSGYYYMGLNSQGGDIYYLAKENALNKTVSLDTQTAKTPATNTTRQNDESLAEINSQAKPYSALKDIYPSAWFPYLEFTDDTSVIGITTMGADPLNWHQYSGAIAVDVDNDWVLGNVNYIYDRWRTAFKLFLQRDIITVRDSNDRLNSFRNDDSATFEAVLPFFKTDYQWSIHAGVSLERHSDHAVEPGGIALPDRNDNLLGLALTYNSARRYPLGISPQYGVKWRLVAEDSDQLNSDFTGQVFTLDWRGFFDLPASHVIATRFVSGSSTDAPNPFRLGGLTEGVFLSEPGNTLYEPTALVFNKRDYALRGYEEGLSQLIGSHMNLAELEWRFPIALVERGIMAPPFGITKLHGKVFYSVGDAWYDDIESADYVESAGVEIHASVVFGYIIPIDVKLGYAKGFNDIGQEELYLQLGIAF